ncbi:MAG: P22 phage major capsid protein family protein [Pseudohongiellaceae bacterium]
MANTIITPSIIAKEALFHLENNVIMGEKVHRQYKKEFVKIGDSVTIRKPVKFTVTDGATRSNQDVIEETTSIVINNRKHVSWSFSTQDLTLTIEEYAERYIKPAMIVLANNIDRSLCVEGAQEFFNSVGTPGTTPANFLALAEIGQIMDEEPVPDDGMRCLVLNPAARWALANGMGGTGSGGIFNAEIVGGMVRKGRLGEIANFDIYGDQNIANHLTGNFAVGTPLVNEAAFTNDSNTINIDGLGVSTANAIRVGDVFAIAGVNSVNDVSKEDSGALQQFVVQATVSSDGSQNALVTVYPDINDGSTASTAAFQTVTALPADNAAVNFIGTANTSYPQNLGFHKNALALVTIPLELPDSAVFKARADWRGYSIRVIKDYDIDSDEEIIRLDILYGVKAIYEELGVRLWG